MYLPGHVIPKMHNPLRLTGYCTILYSHTASSTPLLALHGLFLLMTQHGLEHPRFYQSR